MKRIVILTGAGASCALGVSSTTDIGKYLKDSVVTNSGRRDDELIDSLIYQLIQQKLEDFFSSQANNRESRAYVNFEQMYHAVSILNSMQYDPQFVSAYKPILLAFFERIDQYYLLSLTKENKVHFSDLFNQINLSRLRTRMLHLIKDKFIDDSQCIKNSEGMRKYEKFYDYLQDENRFLIRNYTTNYDDLIESASGFKFKNGYETVDSKGCRRFSPSQFFASSAENILCHLHGSVHMDFSSDINRGDRLDELVWYDSLEEAGKFEMVVSEQLQNDGHTCEVGPIITGLEKIERVQQSPYLFYFSAFLQDVVQADALIINGYGFGDQHINNVLTFVKPGVPIVYIGRFNQKISQSIGTETNIGRLIDTFEMENCDRDLDKLRTLCKLANLSNEEKINFEENYLKSGKLVWYRGFENFLNLNFESFFEDINV